MSSKFAHYGKRPSLAELKRLHGLYQCGMSLAKVGKRAQPPLSRQWVWLYFKQAELPMRKPKLKEQIEYNGKKYTMSEKRYFRCTSGDRHMLHYKVWEDNTGEKVPEGYEVLHKDGNKRNIEFSNLELIKGIGNISRLPKYRSKSA
jgi:hypothetical protein